MMPTMPSHDRLLRQFWSDESGAITVDWVVLTAGIVGLALVVVSVFTPEVFQAAADKVAEYVGEATTMNR
ncbi:MAG: hypothetical protein MUC82_06900 [Cypionkella sp.]|nr:hypothetical protein [Cypionkella sp.]